MGIEQVNAAMWRREIIELFVLETMVSGRRIGELSATLYHAKMIRRLEKGRTRNRWEAGWCVKC